MMKSQGWVYQKADGLQVVGEYLPNTKLISIRIKVAAGPCYEQDQEHGISHLLEHTLSNQFDGHLFSSFILLGADLHAYTVPTETNYLTTVLADYAPKALNLLTNMFTSPQEVSFSTEKNIVLQEMYKAYDNPMSVLYKSVLSTLYSNHPIGRDVLGTIESVQGIDYSHLLSYWRRRYVPANMVLAVYGDWCPEHVIPIVEKCFETQNTRFSSNDFDRLPRTKPLTQWIYKDNLSQQYIGIGVEGPGLDAGVDVYNFSIMSYIFTARVTAQLKKINLAAQVNAFYVPFNRSGFMYITVSVHPSNAQLCVGMLKNVLDSLSWASFSVGEWEDARHRFLLQLSLENENFTYAVRNLISRWQIFATSKTTSEEIEIIDALPVPQAEIFSKHFGLSRCAVTLGSHSSNTLPELAELTKSSVLI